MAVNSLKTCVMEPLRQYRFIIVGLLITVILTVFVMYKWTSNIGLLSLNHEVNSTFDTNFEITPIENFRKYPCIRNLPVSLSLIREGKCVRTILPENENLSDEQDKACFRTRLKVGRQTDMCTYDPKLDLISEYLYRTGVWEEKLVKNMVQVLSMHSELIFMDIGCNIGVYTLSAAMLGRQVISLDANYENLEMLSRSLTLGQLWTNATLIWNAVSNKREVVELKLIKDNVGASRLGDVLSHQAQTGRVIQVQAILLDDLRPLVKGKKVFMKVDVERHELFLFQGAKDFFKEVDVRYIQMEMANTDFKSTVVDILENLGYVPHADPLGQTKLLKKDILIWPGDLYFIKQT